MTRKTIGALTTGILATAIYWRTAYPSIDWWDSSEYSLAAATMGIAGAPGSLVLTLIGWPVVHLLPGDSPAHRLNLLAGVIVAIAAVLVYFVGLKLAELAGEDAEPSWWRVAAATAGALGFAFAMTPWEYAVSYTPYGLTAVFTALIVGVMLRWWRRAAEDGAWKDIALLALLFGIDFSVHRTNALLIPAVLAWILIRRPATFAQWRAWGGAVTGLAAGLSIQLVAIPIAHLTSSPIIWNAPTDLRRFWSYVSLEQLGGGFLIDVGGRKAPFWSVQVADFLRVMGENVIAGGAVAAVFAVVGLAVLWRRDRRLGAAISVVVAIHAALTVLYFNIPANFFRSLDRHYLPVIVVVSVLVVFGLVTTVAAARERSRAAAAVVLAAAVAMPLTQRAGHWRRTDGSRQHFAGDYARSLLASLPANAIHFTVGDNDTFPVLYMQAAEQVRPDVQVINLATASLPDFADQLRRHRPGFPLAMTRAERVAASDRKALDTSVVAPVAASALSLGLPAGTVLPASVTLHPRPFWGDEPSLADVTMLDILRTNAWKRPVTVSVTTGALRWLEPFGRLEGLYWRILPVPSGGSDVTRLRTVLMGNEYRGYADPSVRIEGPTVNFGYLYHRTFKALLSAERADSARCREDAARIRALVPPDRLGIEEAISRLDGGC